MTNDELKYIEWWERNRDRQKKTFRQLYIGLPIGLVFVLPIVINFSSNWYRRAKMQANSSMNPIVLGIAVLGIVIFTSIFYKRFQWDQNEQRYLEMKAKMDREKL